MKSIRLFFAPGGSKADISKMFDVCGGVFVLAYLIGLLWRLRFGLDVLGVGAVLTIVPLSKWFERTRMPHLGAVLLAIVLGFLLLAGTSLLLLVMGAAFGRP
ncbi:hypothetical protein [Lacticaseibacillus sharpeae]|uniref:AI-2E family transporter n=1 Tax=Lacticaseibacillus sharpeae JCM 1186 = DSM 20505 TaxID=1291052 RepID=A0A0R1ZLD6_9LACO|nr:hypothetical protein [Lacticaseibacillus sharpeae]KRM55343.1 hypothetical protein FC18_GL001374 [Lacticaseibacillus sharpeae JCM 1186 = DSM 20505]